MALSSSTRFALFGAGLIAITYGLARFAFGLFVPPIRAELGLTPEVIGLIGALPLISFVFASFAAPTLARRLGARYTAMLSGTLGASGLLVISQSTDATSLGIGVFACGLSTGLMMPALSGAMQAVVERSMHGRVSSIMNAGTSVGVAVAVPAVLFLADAWRLAYGSFVVLAVAGLVATWYVIPSVSRVSPSDTARPPSITRLQWWRLGRLSVFSFLMGFVSAAYWIFAPDLVVNLGKLPPGATGLLWLAVGVAGLGGAVVADLADRNNPAITQALMLMMLSTSLALLAAAPGNVLLAGFSALVFGLAYMSLTGLYLMTGIRLLPGRLSLGPVLPFVAVSLGQAAGSPVVGVLIDRFGYDEAFATVAAIGVVVAVLSPFYPRTLGVGKGAEGKEAEGKEAEEGPRETGLQAAYDHQLPDEDDAVERAASPSGRLG
ncbi:MAG: MFS transporter [Halothiobacillaceae bacterium]|nr:MFS transporter [Halothiobacillaceae bacterium]HER35421.1 MFS transporter [Halothiobacillaceae bacterium]